MSVSYDAVSVPLVSVSNAWSVIASLFVMVLCSAVLEVQRHPKGWSPYLPNVVPHMYFLVWCWMMGCRSLRWISIVKDSLCTLLEASIPGKLCSAMFVSGLSTRLGRNVLIVVVGVLGSCVTSAWVIIAW